MYRKQTLFYNTDIYIIVLSKIFLESISLSSRATDTPDLDFWRCLLNPGWIARAIFKLGNDAGIRMGSLLHNVLSTVNTLKITILNYIKIDFLLKASLASIKLSFKHY